MRWLHVGIATVLFTCASLIGPPSRSVAAQGRDLVRPVILPVLWAGLESAQREGTPEEYAARGRMLMRLIPEWTDGHILVAGQLAFEASLASPDAETALDRLLAALDSLESSRTLRPASAAADEAILKSQARFVYIRCTQDPDLAAAFQARTGESPIDWVTGYLERIPRLRDSAHLQSELCFALIEGLAVDIRLGRSRDRLISSLDTAEKLLDSVTDRELAAEWRHALQKLRGYWLGGDETTLEDLAAQPLLRSIVDALRLGNG